MPRPVLSETTFNSDNIATSILQQANLQIANSNLGVTDISSHFTLQSGWTKNFEHILFFNGFVFWSGYYQHTGGTPSHGETFLTIDNSDYRPNSEFILPTSGHEEDTAARVHILTNGNITIQQPVNLGSTTYYVPVNGYWNVNF